MMPEISLNILDVVQNCIKAEATRIDLSIVITTSNNVMTIRIEDNGFGMTQEEVLKAMDPFFTTRTTRNVGLGVPFFRQAAEDTGGEFSIQSEKGVGTTVVAVFDTSNIDCMPLGDITETVYSLVVFHENIHFRYIYQVDDRNFVLDTKEIKDILGEDISFQSYDVSTFIREYLESNKESIDNNKIL